MKFLSDFVSCFGSINARSSSSETTVSLPFQESAGSSSERYGSRAVMRNTRRKRGRSSGSAAGSADWKPSLGAISEHTVAAVRRTVAEKTQGKRKMKRKGFTELSHSSSATNKVVYHRSGSYSDDYGHGSISAVLPVFSPTPFMF